MKKWLVTVVLAGAFVGFAGCGKDKDKEGGGKQKLDLDQHCGSMFDKGQKGGDKATFVELCKKDAARPKSYAMCAGPSGDGIPYCTKAMEDPALKAEIDAMKVALGR